MGNGVSLSHESVLDLQTILGSPLHPGSVDTRFSRLIWDDRQATEGSGSGDLFVAIRGSQFDGSAAIPKLIERGIRGVVTETAPPSSLSSEVTWWHVDNSRQQFARLVHEAYRQPGHELQVFGITGTNGKSSTVRMLANLLDQPKRTAGWVTTVDRSVAGLISESNCTTPPAHELARLLRDHSDGNGGPMVLEISSHAIDQHRVTGIPLAAAAITQLGRDHLDYHGTEAAYHEVKRSLRHQVRDGGVFLTPSADHSTKETVAFADFFSREVWTAKILSQSLQGSLIELKGSGLNFKCRLPRAARHDVSNALCAAALASSVGTSADQILQGLEVASAVPGRLEQVFDGVFVDYAHTPDALEAVLKSCRELCQGRLRVVFGCGGDRDTGKRPQMGRIAKEYADEIYLTDDNPRSEPSAEILCQIRSGIGDSEVVYEESDRREAIAMALREHGSEDILVIAGKGHETTQEVCGVKTPFDDRLVVREIMGVTS